MLPEYQSYICNSFQKVRNRTVRELVALVCWYMLSMQQIPYIYCICAKGTINVAVMAQRSCM